MLSQARCNLILKRRKYTSLHVKETSNDKGKKTFVVFFFSHSMHIVRLRFLLVNNSLVGGYSYYNITANIIRKFFVGCCRLLLLVGNSWYCSNYIAIVWWYERCVSLQLWPLTVGIQFVITGIMALLFFSVRQGWRNRSYYSTNHLWCNINNSIAKYLVIGFLLYDHYQSWTMYHCLRPQSWSFLWLDSGIHF